jgi:exopolysaccharide biosynthesis protein
MGEQGTTIGFTKDGRAQIAQVKFKIEGAINGSYQWPNNWYVYGFNHTPEGNGVYIYTPERGEYTGVEDGISVVVEDGKVTQKLNGDVSIPAKGYVINFTGQEESLAARFQVGKRVDYKVGYTVANGQSWKNIVTAVGAGPRLLASGRMVIDPVAEGFEETKIVSGSATRSAIGITASSTIILVTVPSATIEELAGIMQQLGAVDALNLDGGASTGLWFKGSTITEPGRLLSNALIFK